MECQTVSGVLGCQGGQMSLGIGVGIATCQRFQPNINFFLLDNPETLKWLPLQDILQLWLQPRPAAYTQKGWTRAGQLWLTLKFLAHPNLIKPTIFAKSICKL